MKTKIIALTLLLSIIYIISFAGKCAYSQLPISSPAGTGVPGLRIFVTAASYSGDLIGVSGADNKCMADIRKPAGATFKAMIMTATERNLSLDWVLQADTTYYRLDGTPIGTTWGDGRFSFNLLNRIDADHVEVWTGILGSWSSSSANCAKWASLAGSGTYGFADAVDSGLIVWSTGSCSMPRHIYCVEQP